MKCISTDSTEILSKIPAHSICSIYHKAKQQNIMMTWTTYMLGQYRHVPYVQLPIVYDAI